MTTRPPFDDGISQVDNVVKVNFTRASSKEECDLSPSLKSNLEKLTLFTKLLEKGIVSIVLDAQLKEVQVPLEFKEASNLRLNFSYRYGLKDLEFDSIGLRATLSFPRGFYFCEISWHAVYLIELENGHSGAVWPDSIPLHLKPFFEMEPTQDLKSSFKQNKVEKSKPSQYSKKKASFLRLVTDESSK